MSCSATPGPGSTRTTSLLTALLQPTGGDRPLTVWREGRTLELTVRPGPLGVALDNQPAPVAILAQRAADEVLRRTRGPAPAPLPGSRAEVEAIARLFDRPTLLLGSDASEQRLDALAAADALRRFDILHLATHGVLDDRGRPALGAAAGPRPLARRPCRAGAGRPGGLRRQPDRRADPAHLEARRRAGDAQRLPDRPGPARRRRGLPGLLAGVVPGRGPQPGAEPVEGGRPGHAVADDPVLSRTCWAAGRGWTGRCPRPRRCARPRSGCGA